MYYNNVIVISCRFASHPPVWQLRRACRDGVLIGCGAQCLPCCPCCYPVAAHCCCPAAAPLMPCRCHATALLLPCCRPAHLFCQTAPCLEDDEEEASESAGDWLDDWGWDPMVDMFLQEVAAEAPGSYGERARRRQICLPIAL